MDTHTAPLNCGMVPVHLSRPAEVQQFRKPLPAADQIGSHRHLRDRLPSSWAECPEALRMK
jgi:hypothetical protein